MDFIAIDFETANPRSDSACQLGIAVVCDNQIVETCSYLIQPPYGGMNPFFTQIHGITAEDVAEQPMFDALWKTVKPYFCNHNLLVAHNAGFDSSVLYHTLKAFEIAIPEITVACTVAMARRTWVGEQSYGLKALSQKFDIEFKHHDAGEDARACAELAIRVLEARNIPVEMKLTGDTIDTIAEQLGIYFGCLHERGYDSCRCRPLKRDRKK